MTESAALSFPWLVPTREEATAKPPDRRPRGPVLIGDLSASYAGRPVFLMHWDALDETGDD
jgi:hypothetical protein